MTSEHAKHSMTTVRAILEGYPPATEWEGPRWRGSTVWLLDRWSAAQLDRAAILLDDAIYGLGPDGLADLTARLLARSPWIEVVPHMRRADAERSLRQWLERYQPDNADIADKVLLDLVRVADEQGGRTEWRYRVHRSLLAELGDFQQ